MTICAVRLYVHDPGQPHVSECGQPAIIAITGMCCHEHREDAILCARHAMAARLLCTDCWEGARPHRCYMTLTHADASHQPGVDAASAAGGEPQ